jgi:hypothetical protein
MNHDPLPCQIAQKLLASLDCPLFRLAFIDYTLDVAPERRLLHETTDIKSVVSGAHRSRAADLDAGLVHHRELREDLAHENHGRRRTSLASTCSTPL